VADDPIVDFGARRPPAPARDSLPPVSDAFRQRADRWKRELLDVTRRNRGINFRPTRTTLALPALPADLWETLLVAEGGISLTARNFAPDAPQPVADERAIDAFAAATRLIERARLADREQGIQVLFAALGWLTWKDNENHQLRSPLVLIPVDLAYNRQERELVLQAAADDPPEVNPSLVYLLHAQYGIRLPELEDAEGEPIHVSLAAFLDAARQAVAKQDGWFVEDEGPAVDVFSFAKLAMVEEIDRSLRRLATHPVLRAIAGEEPLARPEETETADVDSRYAPGALRAVVDADAYQLQAVGMAAAGQSFVIEGPPGTGKSQTITNIMAELMAQGRRVLFVAEKRVAREVVLENLAKAGLAEACLHLAANAGAKSRADAKAQVIKEIIDTLDAGSPLPPLDAALPQRYGEIRQRLNAYAAALARPLGEGSWTSAYDIIGTAALLARDRRDLESVPPIDGLSRFWLDDVLDEAKSLDAFKPHELAVMAGPWSALRWTAFDATRHGQLRTALETLAAAESSAARAATPVLGPAVPAAPALSLAAIGDLATRLEQVAVYRKKSASFLRFLNPGFYSARGHLKQYLAAGYVETRDEGSTGSSLRELESGVQSALAVATDAFGPSTPAAAPVSELSAWATTLLVNIEALPVATEMAAILTRLEPLGMRDATVTLLADTTTHGAMEPVMRASVYAAWASQAMQGDLATTPDQHQRLVDSFVRLDAEMIGWARSAVLAEVRSRRPRSVNGAAMAPLVKYARAKRRPALRTMLGNAREAIQLLKPALFMSPLAAAQYLCHEGGRTYQFDAVIVDEASMIPTPDMVVALSLAPQAIIVGDSRQMPPTNFFNKEIAPLSENGPEEEDVTFESILDEAAPIMPSTMLRAHYRSRDESLIAFSNVFFYDGRLIAFPDAWGDRPESGVRFELVADAVYGRGGTRANPAEALRAIEVLRAELQSSNFQKQVAITAMSLAQQQEIVQQLEQAASADEAIRRWLDSGGLVRNLETVQGDESDVMILSVGYGKDADGRMILNFGPLGQEKGERRLNVAVTRAKWKTVVVSSIRSGDIDPARTSSTGTLRLRDYLDYAERGPAALPATTATAVPAARPFEQVVRAALEAEGVQCVPQVGVGGYRVDIAVRHPQDPERFVLAVECDGPTYFTAPACRDRDLGHTGVLKRMGWQVHRVHAPAWYRNPEAELQRILERYRAAIT
jgi:very-short-patch-repair endonuclease